MNLTDRESYFQLIKSFDITPFTQSEGWYQMHSYYHPDRIIFLINNVKNPTIACFAHVKKWLGIKMLLIEGECYKNEESENVIQIRNFYNDIIQSGFQIVEVSSNTPYHFDYETAMRQAGFMRPVGLFCLPSTKIIRLDKQIEYNKDWRRNIKKANEYNLWFEKIDKVANDESNNFIRIFREMIERKSLSQPFNKDQIIKLCSTGEFQLYFVVKSEQRVASVIIYKFKNFAIPIYSASNSTARQTSASYFMYDELFKHLKSENIDIFDMDKLLPSTEGVNNVFYFKNGINGTHIQLNGEWSWYKKPIYRPMMYFVKKYLMKKREI